MVLRTQLDWSALIEGQPTEDGAVFTVEADAPWIYFKPCLVLGRQHLWTPGLDRIALAGRRDVYPWFTEGLSGGLTEVIEVGGLHVRVYLPAGYAENTLKRYPVLYMHDGGNLFLPEEAFGGGEWQVDETLDQLDGLGVIDQVIVVGVYAGDRMRNYTDPGYRDFAERCTQLLLPWVNHEYRTLTGPKNTAVLGSSLGGVLALHMAWERPEVFGMAGCMSSTFGVFDDLFERVRQGERRELRLYLDSGWPRDNFERTVAMRDLLVQRGYRPGGDLLYLVYPGARHAEGSWADRAQVPFQWFFGKSPFSA